MHEKMLYELLHLTAKEALLSPENPSPQNPRLYLELEVRTVLAKGKSHSAHI